METTEKHVVKTQRTILRCFRPQDLDGLAAILGMHEVMRFSLHGPYSKEQTAKFIDKHRTDYEAKGYSLYAVVHRTDQRLIGYCGLTDQVIDNTPEVEIGYRLHPDYWGQGLATEAALAVSDHGLGNLGLERMISIIEPANVGSIRVAQKIDMKLEKQTKYEGRIPVQVYSIMKRASIA